MGFLIIALIIIVVWLISELSNLKSTVGHVEDTLARTREHLNGLTARLQRVENRGPADAPAMDAGAAAREAVAPNAAVMAPPPAVAAPLVVAPPPVVVRPAAPPVAVPTPPRVAAEPPSVVAPSIAPEPAMAAASVRSDIPHVDSARADKDESWEMVVGTSWLNKIGVLVSIVGLALLVSYSFAHIGAAGRVAIGYALSLTMLAGGVVLERRAPFRNYAYGLVAGGWAGVYFTTFAMHGVPAAKLIDSDVVAVTLLSIVAAGMIAHSLRYRSQVVTSLAFIVGYATLALSPLSGFALAASVPLAVAMLVVAQMFGWSTVAVLGIVSAYGTFVIRSEVFPGAGLDRSSILPYATLGSYWLAFEAAEIFALWRHHLTTTVPASAAPISMLALNAVGLVGSVIVTAPGDNPDLFATFLFGTSVAYIVSAAIRAWLSPDWRARPDGNVPFNSTHAATMTAVLLTAVAIGFRFSGTREILARLLEAEMLVVAGLLLGDVWFRRMGSTALMLAAGSGLARAIDYAGALDSRLTVLSFTPHTMSVVLGLIAIAAYANREALHRRAIAPVWLEFLYTWTGTLLLTTVLLIECTPTHWAFAVLVLAFVLLEVGFRRTPEYIHQAYVLSPLASYALLISFVVQPGADGVIARWGAGPTPLDEWTVLPAAVLLAAIAAWRLMSRPADAGVPGRLAAAGAAATFSTIFLLVFEWRVLAPNAIAPAWALTALMLVLAGTWRQLAALRWQGYVVALGTAAYSLRPLLDAPPGTSSQTWAAVAVIASLYIASYVARRAWTAQTASRESFEPAAVAAIAAAATGLLVVLQFRIVPELQIGPAWTATAIVLLLIGQFRHTVDLRWQGYALLAAGALHTAGQVFGRTDPESAAIVWLAVVIGALYACGIWIRRAARASAAAGAPREGEDATAAITLLAATGLLASLIRQEVEPSAVTLALGLQGLALMFTGLIGRERVLRLSGLGLLLACILKLFLYDLSELEALARIMSFVLLGLSLLAISWTYTRYREQIKKFL